MKTRDKQQQLKWKLMAIKKNADFKIAFRWRNHLTNFMNNICIKVVNGTFSQA